MINVVVHEPFSNVTQIRGIPFFTMITDTHTYKQTLSCTHTHIHTHTDRPMAMSYDGHRQYTMMTVFTMLSN